MRIKNVFTVLSNKRCIVCNTRLKQNLVDVKPKADMCYKHYQMIVRGNKNFPYDYTAQKFLMIKK